MYMSIDNNYLNVITEDNITPNKNSRINLAIVDIYTIIFLYD